MTTAFLGYGVAPTGAPTAPTPPLPRNVPDRLADIINVKDYGALGNGWPDDHGALQAAAEAAFGTIAAPNAGNYYLNKVLYFPPGHYIITSPLILPATFGGRMLGSGSDVTTIENTSGSSVCVTDSGWTYGSVEDITFKGSGGIAFDWTNNHAGIVVGNQLCVFQDCSFEGCDIGLSVGTSGLQSDTSLFINNRYKNNSSYGLHCSASNAIAHTVMGGTFINNGWGILSGAGAAQAIYGCNFSGSTNYDIHSTPQAFAGAHVASCVSTSDNFLLADGTGEIVMDNCKHTGANNGNFLLNIDIPVVMRGCYSSKGQVYMQYGIRSRIINSTFDRSDWLGLNVGNIWSPANGTHTGGYLEIENITYNSAAPTQIFRQRWSTFDGGTTIVKENYAVA